MGEGVRIEHYTAILSLTNYVDPISGATISKKMDTNENCAPGAPIGYPWFYVGNLSASLAVTILAPGSQQHQKSLRCRKAAQRRVRNDQVATSALAARDELPK